MADTKTLPSDVGDNQENPFLVDGKDITQPHPDWVGKCTPTPRRKNATFWKGFHIADDERNLFTPGGKLYAVCNLCGHVLISHNSGTTNLRRHMKSYHPLVFEKLLAIQETEQPAESEGSKKRSALPSSMTPPPVTKKPKTLKKTMAPVQWAELAQAVFCIASNRPFSDLDHPAMKDFVQACINVGKTNGSFLPRARVARDKATAAAETIRAAILDKLKEAKDLVLTIDCWETREDKNTTYVSVRWIEGFRLRHCTLDAIRFSGKVNLDDCMARVQEILKEWGIQEKVAYVVSNQDLSRTGFGGNAEMIECFDNDLQRIVKVEMNRNKFTHIVTNAQNLVEKLDPEKAEVVVDSVARWWSILAMIESLLEQKDILEHGKYLDDADLDDLEFVREVLKAFRPVIKTLSGNVHSTSSLAPFLQFVVHSELSKAAQAEGSSKSKAMAAKDILKQFEARFGKDVALLGQSTPTKGLHRAFWFAHALDPRFKQLKVLKDDTDKDKLWEALLEEMVSFESKTKTAEESGKESKDSSGDTEVASILRGVVKKEESKREEAKSSIFDQYAGVLENGSSKDADSWKDACTKELNLYRSEATAGMRTETGKEDPLSWWKSHRVVFPTLWRLAKVYLAIPATSSLPRLTMNAQASKFELERYDLVDSLPEGSTFLYENLWVLNEDHP